MREIRLKVTAGARSEFVKELPDGRFAVSVKAKAKEGRANDRVRELLAEHFGVPFEKITIARGNTAPSKTVRFHE